MKKLLLIPILALSGLCSDVDSFVKKAIENNPDISILQKELERAVLDKELAGKLENPTLGVSVSAIMPEAPLKRNYDPAQRIDFSITQQIPTAGKLSKRVLIENSKVQEAKERVEQKSLEVEFAIKKELITIASLNAKMSKYNKFIKNYELMISILNSFNASSTGSHTAVIKAELELQNIKNELFDIESKIKSAHAKIKSIANTSTLDTPKIELEFSKIPFDNIDISKSHIIKERLYDVQMSQSAHKLELSTIYPDIGVTVGYSSANPAFRDYAFFGVSIPLPVYGRESISIKKSIQMRSQKQKEYESKLNDITFELEDSKARYEGLKKSYMLLTKLTQRTLEHSLETIFADIKSSKASQENAVNVLNDIVNLEIKTVEIQRESMEIKANLKKLTGDEK